MQFRQSSRILLLKLFKSGFVCEDGRQKTVRKPRSGFTQDVFSAEVWLASAPLHEAGKITKSGNTLKTGIGRGQLSFASDNPSSNPNACPLISTFSKPHSEVTSTTHTSALKCFRKDAQRFSTFIRPEVHTSKCRIVKAGPKGDTIDKPKLSFNRNSIEFVRIHSIP